MTSMAEQMNEDDQGNGQRQLRSLGDILDALDNAAQGGEVSIGGVMDEVGVRAFAPIILVPALILVSPLSGIFGLPTIGATLIFLITIQKMLGRANVWIPDILRRRRIGGDKLAKATSWLRRPCNWIDRRTHTRLTALVSHPANMVTLSIIMAICLVIPALELLPMVTSIFAIAISLYAIGLLTRDGFFTLLGHTQVALSSALVIWLIS